MATTYRDDQDAHAPRQGDPDQWSAPAGCSVNRSRIASTIDVTGWYSAKTRTGPRHGGRGHEGRALMNGRKMSG